MSFTVDDVATRAGTIGYEILTGLMSRYERVRIHRHQGRQRATEPNSHGCMHDGQGLHEADTAAGSRPPDQTWRVFRAVAC
jgi:hypothetical protein